MGLTRPRARKACRKNALLCSFRQGVAVGLGSRVRNGLRFRVLGLELVGLVKSLQGLTILKAIIHGEAHMIHPDLQKWPGLAF